MLKKRANPHDRFFRKAMQERRVIKQCLAAHLPEDIQLWVNLSCLDLQSESLINPALNMQMTDILYCTNLLRTQEDFYILLEHQSTPDKFMPFRIIKYVIGIMDRHVQGKSEKTKALPLIFPIVIYSGNKAYNYSMELSNLFRNRERGKIIFGEIKPPLLINLKKFSYEFFEDKGEYGAMALMMKWVHEKDLLIFTKDIINLLNRLEKGKNRDYINSIVSYLVEAGEISDREKFINQLREGLFDKGESFMPTLAVLWKEEGIEIGIEKGIEKGIKQGAIQTSREIAQHLLALGKISVKQIAECTGLSEKLIRTLRRA